MTGRSRKISAACWLVVAVVLLRAASGGGVTIGSFLYVVSAEPLVSYIAGVAVFVAAAGLAVAFPISDSPRLVPAAAIAALLTAAYGAWWFLLDDHTSGLALTGAAVVALTLAVLALIHGDAPSSAGPQQQMIPRATDGDR
jgi:hypothetical protein